jgi:hypothetical protein
LFAGENNMVSAPTHFSESIASFDLKFDDQAVSVLEAIKWMEDLDRQLDEAYLEVEMKLAGTETGFSPEEMNIWQSFSGEVEAIFQNIHGQVSNIQRAAIHYHLVDCRAVQIGECLQGECNCTWTEFF